MATITRNKNLLQIVNINAGLVSLFEKQGLGNYFKAENIQIIGRFTKLSSLLKSKNTDFDQFIETLNQTINHGAVQKTQFTAITPCVLCNTCKGYFESYIQNYKDGFKNLNYLIEGSVNHKLSYCPWSDNIKYKREKPYIIIASYTNIFPMPFKR